VGVLAQRIATSNADNIVHISFVIIREDETRSKFKYIRSLNLTKEYIFPGLHGRCHLAMHWLVDHESIDWKLQLKTKKIRHSACEMALRSGSGEINR
jgi:hypothetical protein